MRKYIPQNPKREYTTTGNTNIFLMLKYTGKTSHKTNPGNTNVENLTQPIYPLQTPWTHGKCGNTVW